MDFAWMTPNVQKPRDPAESREVLRIEIRRRAALLCRLGRSLPEAVRRCRQNLEWEYDVHGKAALAAEVEELVNDVYRRGPASTEAEPRP